MKLVDLNPKFLGGDPGIDKPLRPGAAIECDCPCGCAERLVVPFKTAFDGQLWDAKGWDRSGDTFEALTLKPSILRRGACGWHGWVTDGQVITC